MNAGTAARPDTSEHRPPPAADRSTVAATAVIAVGLLLTTLPLRSVFTDWAWLVTTVACAAPYWLVVAFFRTRSTPLWWHSVLGLAGSALVIAWIFVPQHLALGIVPTPSSVDDISGLITQARHSLQVEHAPIASTTPLRFMTAGLLTLLAALTDILGVGMRRPLLAGAPMLEILAVSSTTSSKAASPIWFVAAAVGFLVILLAGTRLQDQAWGPAVDGSMGRLGGARTIAVVAIAVALLAPTALPGRSVNLIAKATHHSSTGGGGGQTVLNDLASLRGSLKRGTPTDLFRVTVTGDAKPFYIRQAVLDTFDNTGWVPSATSDSAELSPLDTSNFAVLPASTGDVVDLQPLKADFTTLGLGGQNLPILGNPVSLQTNSRGQWDARTATVAGANLKRNLKYVETVEQPAPTTKELLDAPAATDASLSEDLALPPQAPSVVELAKRLTAGKATPYEKALAISSYFTDGKNGFVYSLSAPAADGRQAIVTFLDKKQGYCQQYAAAAAVLMREAGLPTRVVIGYTHSAPDLNGTFTVSTLDAHAWVETYFDGIGWTPFDPTPLTGSDLARAVTLPYAQHGTDGVTSTATAGASSVVSGEAPAPKVVPREGGAASTAPTQAVVKRTGSPLVWIVLAAVALTLTLLLAGPRLVRRQLRRRRVARAVKAGSAEPLWDELAASAVDLGVLWPDTVTVAQVPGWLGGHGLDERGALAVTAVADRLQRDRYAAPSGSSRGPAAARGAESWAPAEIIGFDEAIRRWGRQSERRRASLARWLPRSLITRRSSTRR